MQLSSLALLGEAAALCPGRLCRGWGEEHMWGWGQGASRTCSKVSTEPRGSAARHTKNSRTGLNPVILSPPAPTVPLTSSCSRGGTQRPGGLVAMSVGHLHRQPLPIFHPQHRPQAGLSEMCRVGQEGLSLPPPFGETEVRCVSTLVNEFAWEKNFHQRHVDLTGPSILISS